MPDNTIYVGRPTKWGNPLKVVGDMLYVDAGYRRTILDPWIYLCHKNRINILNLYEQIITGNVIFLETFFENAYCDLGYWKNHFENLDITKLKGKNLACWCSLLQPCHADILLKFANA